MKNNHTRLTRRQAVCRLALGAGAIPMLGAIPLSAAFAQPAKLDENDPTAVSLGYKSDSTQVDDAKFPNHKSGQMCSVCKLYQGKAGEAYGPCMVFQGKLVSAKGWCSAFVAKA